MNRPGHTGATPPRSETLSHRLRHVYWLGGGSGAGKSTVARQLAASHGMRLYSTDEAMSDHANRSKPEDCPFLTAFKDMDMDERWLNRPPELMLETFHWFRGEAFSLIVEDLLALPADQGVIVEGHRLLPRLVKPLLGVRSQAAWLIPTPEFRLAAFTSRGTLMDIAGKTSAPNRALENLLRRDAMFTALAERAAKEEGLPVINVSPIMTVDDLTSRVSDQFGL
jgi:2-phosphoglycerate kinase